jgi:hypothetical protein
MHITFHSGSATWAGEGVQRFPAPEPGLFSQEVRDYIQARVCWQSKPHWFRAERRRERGGGESAYFSCATTQRPQVLLSQVAPHTLKVPGWRT